MRALVGLVAALAAAAPVQAQQCAPAATGTAARSEWGAPLDRIMTLKDGRVTVRAALERIAANAQLRFSYSAELIPADRYTCLDHETAPAGLILRDILSGTNLVPVIAAGTHIVLSPQRTAAVPVPGMDSVIVLASVVVDGTATRARMHAAGASTSILEGRDVADHATIADAITAGTGTVWAWETSGLTAQFGGLRGATSFGASTPKVYIDGIEVANPLLLSHLDPASVSRIELIRGPQGSAMYGSNAIGGVTNIVTRRASGAGDGDRFTMRTGVGIGTSVFTKAQTIAHDHALSTRLGTPDRAVAMTLGFGSTGEFVPGSWERRLSADGTGHFALEDVVINGTLRVMARQLGNAGSPLLPDDVPDASGAGSFSAAQYTAGVTATFSGSERWTHALTLGGDGYRVGGSLRGAVLSPADSALLAAGASALRGTLRLHSTASLPFGALTISADHSMLHQEARSAHATHTPIALGSITTEGSSGAGIPVNGLVQDQARLRSSSGLGAQLDAVVRERISVSAGLRVDRGVMTDGYDQVALLPMLGGSYRLTDDANGIPGVTLRAAYGRGVRWPDTRVGYAQYGSDSGPAVWRAAIVAGPEMQSGIEAGVDVSFGGHGLLQMTRFDQTATGLTQFVELQRAQDSDEAARVLRNVGDVANRGWELQGSFNAGKLGVAAALSLVDSRVRELSTGYDGDLRAGDRMLAIPARTWSLTSRWTERSWSGSVTAWRASDWINYDRIALAAADQPPEGAALRNYWLRYDGVTHLRATFTRTLSERFSISLSGDNLLDRQTGEPDNVTVLPGRTVSASIRAVF